MLDVLLITGMSGAGRSQVGNTLEDLGWFVIDNMPVELISKVAELARFQDSLTPLALVAGSGQDIDGVGAALEQVRSSGAEVRTLFLEATTAALVRRYGDTKRRHPMLDATGSTEAAIEEERRALSGLKETADIVIDTTGLNVHDLRRQVTELFEDDVGGRSTQLTVMSFGYKHGVPSDADIVLDCRFLPNPHWVEDLRPLTGLDDAVQNYVNGSALAKGFVSRVEDLIEFLVPAYVEEGRSVLTIAFGCTGGRHRSVSMAEHFGTWLNDQGFEARVRHRDIEL